MVEDLTFRRFVAVASGTALGAGRVLRVPESLVGAEYYVVAGREAIRYSLMRLWQRWISRLEDSAPVLAAGSREPSVVVGGVSGGVGARCSGRCSRRPSFELLLVPYDAAVEEIAADEANPSFIEGAGHRGADGGFEDLEAVGPEDLVEAPYEFAVSVANEGLRVCCSG